MNDVIFQEFLDSTDTLRVFHGKLLVFASQKDRLFPLLDYIKLHVTETKKVLIFDKVMGNAAALLSAKAGGKEVYSPLGSQFAILTLEKYGIKYHLSNIVPYITTPDGSMCPMEKLSLNKKPEEFYQVLAASILTR
jgi:hypothetical protein